MKYCTQCGRELMPGARFCVGCGAAVAATPTPEPMSTAASTPDGASDRSAAAATFEVDDHTAMVEDLELSEPVTAGTETTEVDDRSDAIAPESPDAATEPSPSEGVEDLPRPAEDPAAAQSPGQQPVDAQWGQPAAAQWSEPAPAQWNQPQAAAWPEQPRPTPSAAPAGGWGQASAAPTQAKQPIDVGAALRANGPAIARDVIAGVLLLLSLTMTWTGYDLHVVYILTVLLALVSCAVPYVLPLLNRGRQNPALTRLIRFALVAPLLVAILVAIIRVVVEDVLMFGVGPAIAGVGALLATQSGDRHQITARALWVRLTTVLAALTVMWSLYVFVRTIVDLSGSSLSGSEVTGLVMVFLVFAFTTGIVLWATAAAARGSGVSWTALATLAMVAVTGTVIATMADSSAWATYSGPGDLLLLLTLTAAMAPPVIDSLQPPVFRGAAATTWARGATRICAIVFGVMLIMAVLSAIGVSPSGWEIGVIVFLVIAVAGSLIAATSLERTPAMGHHVTAVVGGVIFIGALIILVGADSAGRSGFAPASGAWLLYSMTLIGFGLAPTLIRAVQAEASRAAATPHVPGQTGAVPQWPTQQQRPGGPPTVGQQSPSEQ